MNEATLSDTALHEANRPTGTSSHPFAQQTQSRNSSLRALYRHPTQRVLAGVCGGVADWLGWDPVVVRVLWVALAFATSGAGFVVYLLLALLLPVGMQPSATQPGGAVKRAPVHTRLHSGKPLAFLLIGLGLLWLLSNLGLLHGLTHVVFDALKLFFWPVLLIVIGWKILLALGVKLGDGEAMRTQMNAWGARASAWSDELRSGAASASPTAPVQNTGARDTEAQDTGAQHTGAQDTGTLRRSRVDRVLLGVCGGIAQRYHIDPVLVRLLWVLVTLGTLGFGLIAYLLAALLLPQADAAAAAPDAGRSGHKSDPAAEQEIPIAGAHPVDF